MTIRSKLPTQEYKENYDRIFRQKKQEQALEQSDHKQMELDFGEEYSYDQPSDYHQGE